MGGNSGPYHLRAQDLQKSFGRRRVVHGASVDIKGGEVVGLLGPNGSGKTTLFYMIIGLLSAESGQVLLNDHDITHLPIHERARLGMGYLPQDVSVFRGLTVENNIKAVLEYQDISKAERTTRLENLLEDFGIARLRKANALTLSGGERRRLEIARALASNPRILLLDEPFAGVDPIAVKDLKIIVRGLIARGIGVLITDHNVRETLELSDRAFILTNGKVLFNGTSAEIIANVEVQRHYLGDTFQPGTNFNEA